MQALQSRDQLRRILARIDGRPYAAYRDLTGGYDFGVFRLEIQHVQPDPYAPATRLVATTPARSAGLDPADLRDATRRTGTEDWLLRRLAASLARAADAQGAARPLPSPGQGPVARPSDEDALPAGCLRISVPGQQVLERSALMVVGEMIEIRLLCDLPAEQRRVLASRAAAALDVALPAAIASMWPQGPGELADLRAHLDLLEDQEALRAEVRRRGWVAFLADGAILPRANGVSDLPLPVRGAVRLCAPEALSATVDLPHRGTVRGLVIRDGVTLIVGGAYHGKSTLLRAIERGVYNHVAGDGRELCVTRTDAVTIASEDGRPVSGVDIAAFVRPLPGGVDTQAFRTVAASGSTSQAAALCEALEMGSRCVLIDEDRSAANFISRDARMRALVPDGEDPVVPFSDRLRWLSSSGGVSVVVVVGGAGSLLDTADTVIRMREYLPEDATAKARAVAQSLPGGALPAGAPTRDAGPAPALAADALGEGPSGRLRVRARGRALTVGEVAVDLRALTQIVEESQVQALADMVARAAHYCDGRRAIPEIVREVVADVDRLGFAALSPRLGQISGDYARPRPWELGAALARVPGLRLAGDPEREAPRPSRTWRPLPGVGSLTVRRRERDGAADRSAQPQDRRGARERANMERGGVRERAKPRGTAGLPTADGPGLGAKRERPAAGQPRSSKSPASQPRSAGPAAVSGPKAVARRGPALRPVFGALDSTATRKQTSKTAKKPQNLK